MGDESTIDLIKTGNQEIFIVAAELRIPIAYQVLDEKLKDSGEKNWEIPVKYIKRFMPTAIW